MCLTYFSLNGTLTAGLRQCCTSEDALGRHIVPHSPVLSGRATALDPTLSPSFAALPPPAFGLVPFFESVDGSWGSCKGSAPWDPLDDVDKTRYPRLQPKRSFATPSATASSTCESRCSKRHARSSLTRPSLSQRSNETTKKPGYATSACHAEQLLNTNSTMVFNDGEMSTRINRSCPLSQNSFGPLHDLRNSTTITTKSVDRSPTYSPRDSTPGVWDVENVTVKAERDVEHQKQDSGCYVDLDDSISDTDEVRVQNPRPNDPNGFLFSGSANSNPLTPPNHVADFRVGKEPPLNFAFFDRQRVANSQIETSNSVSPWDTEASSCSSTRASSSSLDVIVEQDPQIRKDSRREQAILWQLLSQSESDKENQPQTMKEEARLSGEEKSAMAEAMQRSLGDLAGTFDDIFLTDNCESNSGDGL